MEWVSVQDVINGKTENFKNCVYMWRNKVNGKLYVGIARDFRKRTREHRNVSFNKNCKDYDLPLHRSIRKRGIENYEICILEKNLNHDEMRDKEDFYIEKYDTLKKNEKGYNIATSGGSNNPLAGKTPEEKREIGKKHSEALKGENNPNYGKHLSEEQKQKISENHADVSGKNNPRARKVVLLNTGEIFDYIKQASEKYGVDRNNIAECCKGTRNSAGVIDGKPGFWLYLEDYEKLSEEEINKIKNEEVPNGSRPKAVICVTTRKTYDSLSEASRQTGVSLTSISKCCNRKQISVKDPITGEKLIFMFLDEYLESK